MKSAVRRGLRLIGLGTKKAIILSRSTLNLYSIQCPLRNPTKCYEYYDFNVF